MISLVKMLLQFRVFLFRLYVNVDSFFLHKIRKEKWASDSFQQQRNESKEQNEVVGIGARSCRQI